MDALVGSHSMLHPEGWPILPAHEKTTLILNLHVGQAVGVRLGAELVGHGMLLQNQNRQDCSHLLERPEFVSLYLGSYLQDDQGDELCETLFGVSMPDLTVFYRTHIDSLQKRGISPFFQVALDEERFLEIEDHAGVEFETRFWLGTRERKVCVGYHSGHFSLPAFRLDEVLALARPDDSLRKVAALLICTRACLEPSLSDAQRLQVSALARRLPFLRVSGELFVAGLWQNIHAPDVTWSFSEARGWTNSWSAARGTRRDQCRSFPTKTSPSFSASSDEAGCKQAAAIISAFAPPS